MTIKIWTPTSFSPAAGITSGHAQTIITNIFRRNSELTYRRERLSTSDGDFIDLDYADVDGRTWDDLGAETPIVLHLHGLEGSARRGYAAEAYRKLATHGIRAVGMNFRSCSGEINRTARFYHAGATDDIAAVYHHLDQKFPGVPKGIIGVSLGANMLLKLLGEWGDQAPDSLRAAAAVSPPFDMVAGSPLMMNGSGLWYGRRFLNTLLKKITLKRHLLEDKIDIDRVLSVRNLVEFDEYGTAPLNGFVDAQDYYRQNSCGQFLPHIQRPTLVIRALDDPLMAQSDIPYEIVARNRYLTGLFPAKGGHVGFSSGSLLHGLTFWSETQAARFLAHHLLSAH